MLKVVYDHQIFWWQAYGGISRYIYEVATRMADRDDCQVKILGLAYVNEYLKQCKPGLVSGLPIPNVPSLKVKKMVGKLNDNLAEIFLNRNKYDIVHETYYHPQRLSPKESNIVLTVHDMIHEKFSRFWEEAYGKSDATSEQKKAAVKRADGIICVSENTKKDLIEILDVDPQKVWVVYHGPPLKFIDPGQHEVTETDRDPYIFYVGDRKSRYKNFERLLRAYAISGVLKNNFNIVCFGGGSLSGEELSLIQRLGLSEGKVLQVSGDDTILAKFYRESSVFVYPSLYEGFGIPLLEAMSLNCPIACSNTSSIPEVVGKAAEFFDPEDPESIAIALEKVVGSVEKTQNLVKLGKQRVQEFSWEACVQQTRDVYLSLL
jgi:glycosyltransferase involved in cell wall biosynthesis